MRIPTFLRVLPPLFLLALTFPACGGKVVVETGAAGGGGGGPAPSEYNACSGPGQCVLVSNSCCGTCGTVTLADQAAINITQGAAFLETVCPEPTPCPACASMANPNLFAICEQGTCRGADVRTEPESACTTNADCQLRYGTGCCDSCDGAPWQLVAVSTSSNLSASQCAPGTGCDGCLPQYPKDAEAICSNGHCQVVFAGQGG